ncbi:MAG: RDD family protein [Nitrospinota bacterium]|nr:RDD family protein [Nitrospinota bacterium]
MGVNSDQDTEGMELCQVTGKLVAKDEIVEFQGYRVCAEGKQELLRRMRAGLAMPGELETATFPKRLLALILDMVILWLVFQAAGLVLGISISLAPIQFQVSESHFSFGFAFSYDGLVQFSCYMAAIIYFAVFHGRYGQSLGKMVLGIKLIKLDGRPAGFRQAIIRAIILIGPVSFVPLFRYYAWEMINETKSWNYMLYIEFVHIPVLLLLLTSGLLALIDRAEQKSLHDRLAATRVVVKQ